jgi:hypothetical protein
MKQKILKIWIVLLTLCTISNLKAVDIFEEFKNNIQEEYLTPFTKDLTGLVCGDIVNNADNLELFTPFPPSIGLNIRVYSLIKEIDKENQILQNAFEGQQIKYLLFPILQVEKGLPFNIDLVGRFSGYYYKDFIFYGFGLKYKVLSLSILNFSVGGFYNFLEVKDILKMSSVSYNFVFSVNKIAIVTPYVALGLDSGELQVDEKIGVGSMKGKFSDGIRYELGANISLLPIFYLNLGYSKVYDTYGYSFGLGVRF